MKYSNCEMEMKGPGPDWTDSFDRQHVVKRVNQMIDELVLEIYTKKLAIHKGLSSMELALLYRFPIHVAVNTFFERLLRTVCSIEMKLDQTYPGAVYQPGYFKNTVKSVQTYYFNLSLNYNLLHNIYVVLSGSNGLSKKRLPERARPQDLLLKRSANVKVVVKNTLKAMMELYANITKPEVVGEYSNWMRGVLPIGNLLVFDFEPEQRQIDDSSREQMKECSKAVFCRYISIILNILDQKQEKRLAKLFANWVDDILPLSIVEGLNDRFSHYGKITSNWDIKQVHSCNGYYYNENFKIFAILAKRKKALLISHAHGASNPIPSYKHICNELAFIDYYFTWAKTDSNWMRGNRKLENLTILNLGSPYLSTIGKWRKERVDPGSITLLYPSGPLMDFMSDLEEITPEKHYRHRINALKLLKEIKRICPRLKILYKPFPGTYTNDPIKHLFRKELEEKAVELVSVRPLTLYDKVDVVLWDSISTGFAESIQSGVPALVFHSQYEYEQATEEGKKLDEALKNCGAIFYDVESGIRSFNKVLNQLPEFMASSNEAISKFKEAVSYPITARDFRRKMKLVFLNQ